MATKHPRSSRAAELLERTRGLRALVTCLIGSYEAKGFDGNARASGGDADDLLSALDVRRRAGGWFRIGDLADALLARDGVDIDELADEVAQRHVVTSDEMAERATQQFEAVRERLYSVIEMHGPAAAHSDALKRWIREDREWIERGMRSDGDAFVETMSTALTAAANVDVVSGRGEALSTFAARVLGDPHALDIPGESSTGRRFLRALNALAARKVEWSESRLAASVAALLSQFGLVRDDISSAVTVVALRGTHPMVAAAHEAGIVWTIPRLALKELGALSVLDGVVFVMENPAVLDEFVRRFRDARVPPALWPTIVCGGGDPSLAVHDLLAQLVRDEPTLRISYSGDLDEHGHAIAYRLRDSFGDRIDLSSMMDVGTSSTRANVHSLSLDARTNRPLLYQEQFLDRIWMDVIAPVTTRHPRYSNALVKQRGDGPE